MGLIDFVRDAGAKLFGGDKEAEKAKPKPQSGAAPGPVTMDDVRAKALAKAVKDHGLVVEGLAIQVKGERATVRGKVADQATREKVCLVCGNTASIAQVDDQLEVQNPEPPAQFYTVVKGDTLSKIAKQHYGNANKYPVIFEANKPMLKSADLIYPGQVLRIPPQSP